MPPRGLIDGFSHLAWTFKHDPFDLGLVWMCCWMRGRALSMVEGTARDMRSIFNQLATVTLLLILFSVVSQTQTAPAIHSKGSERDALEFTRAFYDWYVSVSREGGSNPSWGRAVENRPEAFSVSLANALKGDLNAQSKAGAEIVGIDFDPFLNTQDPDDGYEARNCEKRGDHYFVKVYRIGSDHSVKRASVVAELYLMGKKWQFVDFHYSQGGSLLRILAILRFDRGRH